MFWVGRKNRTSCHFRTNNSEAVRKRNVSEFRDRKQTICRKIKKHKITVCCPSMLLAFLTLFLQASRSNLFDSKIPLSLVIVFISPSKKRRSGCMKHECDEPIKSRSHCPSFCSACPTFVKALPYGPSLPNSAPAFNTKTQRNYKNITASVTKTYFDHIQSHVL